MVPLFSALETQKSERDLDEVDKNHEERSVAYRKMCEPGITAVVLQPPLFSLRSDDIWRQRRHPSRVGFIRRAELRAHPFFLKPCFCHRGTKTRAATLTQPTGKSFCQICNRRKTLSSQPGISHLKPSSKLGTIPMRWGFCAFLCLQPTRGPWFSPRHRYVAHFLDRRGTCPDCATHWLDTKGSHERRSSLCRARPSQRPTGRS